MDQLIRNYPYQVLGFITMAIAATLGALHKLGWLKIGKKEKEWNGTERRECANHPHLQSKVCSLYEKLEAVDTKLDEVSENVQYLLGMIEAKWGGLKGR